jgi:hypothetical protein
VPAEVGVKPALGWYVPLPETVAVPTVVPPLVHVLGALAWGPKTLNVIVPVAPAPAPESVEPMALVAMVVLVASAAGPLAEVEVAYWTLTVLVNAVVALHDEWYLAVILYSKLPPPGESLQVKLPNAFGFPLPEETGLHEAAPRSVPPEL